MGSLGGHAEQVLELLWRPAEELLCCHCAPAAPGGDSLLYVWQLGSGRLERVLRGAEAAPHLAAMARAPLCQTVPETWLGLGLGLTLALTLARPWPWP